LILKLAMILGLAFTVYGCYFLAVAIAGNTIKKRTIPPAPPVNRIAAIIPARNEQAVIAKLIDSLLRQRYPRTLFDVYVVPNNCTDNTRKVALDAGAKVLDIDVEVHSKGEVLRWAFEKLLNGETQYDAFCIFDADNVVDGGFFQATNNALAAGYGVAQGYRDSKNPDDNWVAGCTSIFFWFMNRFFNHARFALNMSASLNGTGIMFSADTIRKIGFDTFTLTEDQEFTGICAQYGVKIGWMEEAITYDEQPISLRDSFVQRRRWGAGTLQCFKRYRKELAQAVRKRRSLDALDVLVLFAGTPLQGLGLASFALCVAEFVRQLLSVSPREAVMWALWMLAMALVSTFVGGFFAVVVVCTAEKKWSHARLQCLFMMGFYLLTWMPANMLALVTRPPKWVQIPHIMAVGIDDRMAEPPAPSRFGAKETDVS
jgi:cellulose synthase/poly-beta-1,6-N-acetylglucosamine synthase-like glycosyltransferase